MTALRWYRRSYFWYVVAIVVFLVAAAVDTVWLLRPSMESTPNTDTSAPATVTDGTVVAAKPTCEWEVGYYDALAPFLVENGAGTQPSGTTVDFVDSIGKYTDCTLKWVKLTGQPNEKPHLIADPLISARAKGKFLILSNAYDKVHFKILVRTANSSIGKNALIYAHSGVIEAVQILYPEAKVTETPQPVGTAVPDAVVLRGTAPEEFKDWRTLRQLEIPAVIGVPKSDPARLLEVNSVIMRRPTTPG